MLEMVKAKDEDRFFLARVCRSVANMYDPIMPGAFAKQAVRFEEKGLLEGYETWLIYFENRQVGFIGVKSLNRKILYLVALYLLSEEQRKGLGKKALEQLEQVYRSQGYQEIVLLAHQDANWAIAFYQKNGFEIIGTDEEEIFGYQDSILKGIYLPSTVLMRFMLT